MKAERIKMDVRKFLCSILRIQEWHIGRIEKRPYAQFIVKKINEMIKESGISDGKIIEIGCGVGDIISAINYRRKIGYDIDKRAIWGGRIIHPLQLFKIGTFDDINDENICVLIAVNFLHTLDSEYCRSSFSDLLKTNCVSCIVVDAVSSPPYDYCHDYEKLLGDFGYILEYRSKGFFAMNNSRRRILFFKKAE